MFLRTLLLVNLFYTTNSASSLATKTSFCWPRLSSFRVWFCHMFPFAAKETWTVIVAPLCCLTSNGRAGFFCVESFRKPQIQCLVRRLQSQAIDQVFLPIPIPSFPFQISTPTLACNVPSSTSVLPKKKVLVCACLLQNGQKEDVLMAILSALPYFS